MQLNLGRSSQAMEQLLHELAVVQNPADGSMGLRRRVKVLQREQDGATNGCITEVEFLKWNKSWKQVVPDFEPFE